MRGLGSDRGLKRAERIVVFRPFRGETAEWAGHTGSLEIAVVDVAPAPVFAFFGGLDDGVLGGVEVGARVAVL